MTIMAMATCMRVRGQRKVAMRKVAAMDRLLHIPFTANAESAVVGNMVAIRAVGHTGNNSETSDRDCANNGAIL